MEDPAFAPPTAVQLPGLPDDPPASYALQPGDVVRLRVASVDAMELPDRVVDSLGVIHVSLAGDVVVGGLGISEVLAMAGGTTREADDADEPPTASRRP